MDELLGGLDGYAKHFGVPAEQLMRMPKEDDADGWGQLFGRLGRPEKPEDYAFNGIDLKNEGDKAFVEGFRGTAHQLGLSQKQMDGLMGYLGGSVAQLEKTYADQVEAQREAAAKALSEAWGDKADIYRNEIPNLVEKLAAKAGLYDPKTSPDGGKAIYEALNADGLTDNPTFMRMLAAMADMTAEGGNLPGVGGENTPTPASIEQAKADFDAFTNSPEYQKQFDTKDPAAARAAKEKYQSLLKAAFPDAA